MPHEAIALGSEMDNVAFGFVLVERRWTKAMPAAHISWPRPVTRYK
ncbi:MAG: hypothetical protein ACI82I_002259 [Gammaproteobacteria bacterium]|jgi:hypothetical protein